MLWSHYFLFLNFILRIFVFICLLILCCPSLYDCISFLQCLYIPFLFLPAFCGVTSFPTCSAVLHSQFPPFLMFFLLMLKRGNLSWLNISKKKFLWANVWHFILLFISLICKYRADSNSQVLAQFSTFLVRFFSDQLKHHCLATWFLETLIGYMKL